MTRKIAEQNREIGEWLLVELARDEQTARALPTALGGLLELWSKSVGTGGNATLRYLAESYADKPGYRDEWKLA